MSGPIPTEMSKINELGCLKTNESLSVVKKTKDAYRLMELPVMERMKAKAPAVNTPYPSFTLSRE